MPNCEKYRELCSASIDSELSLEQKRELSEHLSECPACAAYLDDLREMRNAWDDFKQPLPDDMHEHIMKAVLKEAQKPIKTKRHFPVFTIISAVAACTMLVLSGAIGDIISMISYDNNDSGAKPTGKLVMENIIDEEEYVQPEQIEPSHQQEQTQQQTEQPVQNEQVEPVEPKTTQPEPEKQAEVKPRIAETPPVEQQQTEQNANKDKQIAPATFSENPELKKNAAERQSVEIPYQLQTSSFAFCLVAVGSADVPAIENAEFIEKHDSTYYFKVTGVISDFDKTIAELKEKGFETTMRDDLGIKIDANASNGLLILVTKE